MRANKFIRQLTAATVLAVGSTAGVFAAGVANADPPPGTLRLPDFDPDHRN